MENKQPTPRQPAAFVIWLRASTPVFCPPEYEFQAGIIQCGACHQQIECVGVVDPVPGMRGAHRVLDRKGHDAQQNGRSPGCHAIGIAIGFIKIHSLPDEGNPEDQEDHKREQSHVHHGIHRHGFPAQKT